MSQQKNGGSIVQIANSIEKEDALRPDLEILRKPGSEERMELIPHP